MAHTSPCAASGAEKASATTSKSETLSVKWSEVARKEPTGGGPPAVALDPTDPFMNTVQERNLLCYVIGKSRQIVSDKKQRTGTPQQNTTLD
jgi:hypothetical protein